MMALFTIPLTCWLCAWIAKPGKPLRGDEVQELVYARLLGRQQRLVLLALFVTAAAVLAIVISLPRQLDPDLRTVRQARQACREAQNAASNAGHYDLAISPHCHAMQPDGGWATQAEANVDRVCHFTFSDDFTCSIFQADGTWLRTETTVHGVWIVTANPRL